MFLIVDLVDDAHPANPMTIKQPTRMIFLHI